MGVDSNHFCGSLDLLLESNSTELEQQHFINDICLKLILETVKENHISVKFDINSRYNINLVADYRGNNYKRFKYVLNVDCTKS
uniref:Uncharacterized protein n=1 Tax=Panagrolaimus davidi TaxID=227884 RepID=A0A914PVY6_9BILA